MLYNYIKVGSDKIVKATPSGYTIKELKTSSGYWTSYETSEFTNRSVSDFTVVNSPRTIENPFNVFIQKKSVTAKNNNEPVDNALNIDSHWDRRFPETIRLKYPGVITNNNFSERKKLNKEEVYTFKIWENREVSSLESAKVIPDDMLPNIINTADYFYDLQTFIKLDNGTSYEEWLKRPSFSLKNLLTKGIQRDEVNGYMYQLYKINDTNVQSLSTDFDEYIPWCFDQHGKKINQYKIATITSFNKKEIYILLEIRKEDVMTNDLKTEVEIPIITEVIFWRSGLSDSRITMDIRNKDQMLLLKDGKVSNTSEYFKESRMKTNTLVSFQKDRLENEIEDMTPVDNNNNEKNTYELEYNSDPYFNTEKAKNVSRKMIFGRKDDNSLNVSMGGNVFSDHSKNRVHVFVDGNLLTNDEFHILEGYVISTLASASSYVEIYINQYTSISYSFTLATAKSSLTQDELSYILYNNGFLWKTKQDKEYLLFNKDTFGSKSVNGSSVSSGKYLIIHSLFYNMDDTITPTPASVVDTVDLATDLSDSRDYNINYDPMLFKTSEFNGNGSIKDKDIWIFDNTKGLIKISDNEPYLSVDDEKIKVMNQVDKNIALVVDADIVGLKNALTAGNVHNEILSAAEKNYLTLHYSQMSTVNRNILNMFLYSGITTWSTLAPNTPIKIKKDYMVVRYTGTDDFPLLTVHKPSLYQYNTALGSVQVKVNPVRIVHNYYILHRTDETFSNLYEYSFNKQIDFIII